MVISVLSSQDIEFFKDNPSPVYSFVDDVTKMVDIAPLKAKKRPCNEVQEGVKVKCCDYNFEPSVNHLKYMSSPYDCESKYPYPTAMPCCLHVMSRFIKSNWFWVCRVRGRPLLIYSSREFSELFIQKY